MKFAMCNESLRRAIWHRVITISKVCLYDVLHYLLQCDVLLLRERFYSKLIIKLNFFIFCECFPKFMIVCFIQRELYMLVFLFFYLVLLLILNKKGVVAAHNRSMVLDVMLRHA